LPSKTAWPRRASPGFTDAGSNVFMFRRYAMIPETSAESNLNGGIAV
jgi:hypothetical protein